MPSTQPYGDSTLAMPVNGRGTDVGAVGVLALGSTLGLSDAVGRRVLRRAVEQVDGWLPLLDDNGRRDKLARVVRQHQRRLMP